MTEPTQAFSLPYGSGQITFDLPANLSTDLIVPRDIPAASDPLQVVRSGLETWLQRGGIELLAQVQTAAIAINDKTRPVPHQHMLPPLLEMLEAYGIKSENIRFHIATGTHQPMPAEEFPRVLPAEMIARYHVESHDCDDPNNLVSLGTTRRGTPVTCNRRFYEADLRIVVGNIEPHHFMGFSGGIKTAGIGLGGRECINTNHILLMEPNSTIGRYTGNPIREDLEEMGPLLKVQLALNVILNGKKEIVHAVAGSPLEVMEAGIPLSRAIFQTPVSKRYDLVIASPGGHPKDINLYQAQKALTHASLLTKDGGVVILVAACPEGSGSAGYENFMRRVTSFEEVPERLLSEGFQIGPHKAYQIARDAVRLNIIVLSKMPAELVRDLLRLQPASSPAEAVATALRYLPADPEIAILPRATNTIPQF